MHDIGFFADIQYANILQLIWPVIDTNNDTYVKFSLTPNCRDHQVPSVVEFPIQYYYAYSYCVGPPANAGIIYRA